MASVNIRLERDFPNLEELRLTTAADMREIGLLAREQIVTRTRQGLGPDGQPLTPLSEGYAAQKRAALGTAAPDLTVSGNMLNHLQIVEVTDDAVTLGWEQ
jgi:hypothetical protein